MSRWLSSVNNLLEKLDDRVETVVEERAAIAQDNDYSDDLEGERNAGTSNFKLDLILAKRGLSSIDSQDEEDPNGGDKTQNGEMELEDAQETWNPITDTQAKTDDDNDVSRSQPAEETPVPSQRTADISDSDEAKNSCVSTSDGQDGAASGAEPQVAHTAETPNIRLEKEVSQYSSEKAPPATPPKRNNSAASNETRQTPIHSSVPYKLSRPTTMQPSSSLTASRPPGGTLTRTQRERELTLEMKEAQKEARILRRHVVSLNEQLEAAENELRAQRKELERAAERMEKDRVRCKEEKEASQKRQAQEIVVLKEQNEKTLKDQQSRFEEKFEGYRIRLLEEENKRKQEGGDWNKEMSQAIDREQEMRQAVSALEDEKAVLLSQISTLEGQQTALGSRLESLTQTADNAMEREREAEDRMDSLLNQHARQISQRQVSWSRAIPIH